MSCQHRSPGSHLSDDQVSHSEYFSHVNNSYATTVNSGIGSLVLPCFCLWVKYCTLGSSGKSLCSGVGAVMGGGG